MFVMKRQTVLLHLLQRGKLPYPAEFLLHGVFFRTGPLSQSLLDSPSTWFQDADAVMRAIQRAQR